MERLVDEGAAHHVDYADGDACLVGGHEDAEAVGEDADGGIVINALDGELTTVAEARGSGTSYRMNASRIFCVGIKPRRKKRPF